NIRENPGRNRVRLPPRLHAHFRTIGTRRYACHRDNCRCSGRKERTFMQSAIDKSVVELTHATIGFSGDSGDGMQLVGTEFASASASLGNDISTLPDFPAEIRAPAGSLAGVSGFQVQFSADDIFTPGDKLNALVAMNPAALRKSLKDLEPGGILIVN